MRTRARVLAFALPAALAVALVPAGSSSAQEKKGGFGKAKSFEDVTAAAVGYLKTNQADDGSWSKATHPGITGVVLTGLFKAGLVKADDPMAAKGLAFVATLADDKEGHLAKGEQIRHKFYTTSVNMQALAFSGDKKYAPLVTAAATYFKNGQTGATDKKTKDDPNFGSFGYGPGSRGDVSNTHFALDALLAAGTPKDDPVFARAAVFVSRCQNLKSEFNDQPFAGKINDGSFIYVLPAAGGTAPIDTPRPGYGSMTFAGIKCLALAGVGPDDVRRKKATEWIAANYSVDVNPGRGAGAGGQGYFYYLVSMARCLDTPGVDMVKDASGKEHDWRAEITRALTLRQKRDGSWGNDFAQWMESDPNLDTGYALIALGYAKPRAE